MSPAPRLQQIVLAGVATAMLVTAGCTGANEDEPDDTPPPRLADVRPDLPVQRAAFCEAVGEDAARRAVGEVVETAHYDNGDRAALVDGERRDVAHEFGCSFTGTTGDVARAWVFVPQVTRKRARALVRAARGGEGCRTLDAGGFGAPSAATVCEGDKGVEVTWRGLFGGAWFSCSLRSSTDDAQQAELVERGGAWCAAAVQAAAS